jgi:SPX domain protein involved in polyphosphate accumulation
METESESLRYEIKMECHEFYYPEVKSWVNRHSVGFHEAYPTRQVNSLYLDTLDLDTYNDHMEGLGDRQKLRFRWYGPPLDCAKGQLELKGKHERLGWKRIQPVNTQLHLQEKDWTALQEEIQNGIEGPQSAYFKEMLRVSRPFVINSYQRDYYVSADEQIRLTLDYNQKAYDQWMTARPNITFSLPIENTMIIEFKCKIDQAKYLADVIAEFPLRIHQHSKFISAIDSWLAY